MKKVQTFYTQQPSAEVSPPISLDSLLEVDIILILSGISGPKLSNCSIFILHVHILKKREKERSACFIFGSKHAPVWTDRVRLLPPGAPFGVKHPEGEIFPSSFSNVNILGSMTGSSFLSFTRHLLRRQEIHETR